MKILGFEVLKGKEFEEIKKKLDYLTNNYSYTSDRVSLDYLQTLGSEGVRIPYYPVNPRTLYDLAYYCDTLRTIIQALKKELLREGIEIVEKYICKCVSCGKEFQHLDEDRKCDICGGALIVPNEEQKQKFLEWKKNVNENNQSLEEVLAHIEDDLNIIDDAYLVILKDYFFDSEGKIISAEIREVLRGYPIFFKIIADKTGRPGRDDEGREVYTCAEHREKLIKDRETCAVCGKRLYRAYFQGRDIEGKEINYIAGEVLHISKYTPSLTYGFSPILSVWQKVVTLLNQDRYIKTYYTKQRPPRGLLLVKTTNQNSLLKAWQLLKEMTRKDPHAIHPLAIEGEQGGRFAEFINFMDTLEEMQFIEARQEYRRTIGCYDEKTEILTNNGWKKFKDLNKNDLVAQVHNPSFEIEFVLPTRIYEYDYNGDMYHISHKAFDLLLTPNHNIYFADEKSFYEKAPKYRFIRADKIRRGIIQQAGAWKGKEIKWLDVRREIGFRYSHDKKNSRKKSTLGYKKFSGDDYCAFMGIWLAEGSASKWKNHHKVQVAQSKKSKYYTKIKELLSRMPFNFYELQKRGFVINSKELYNYLSQFGHASDKFVPSILKNASQRQIKIFLEWFKIGDGCFRKGKGKLDSSTSISKRLIDDVQEMLLKIGISANIYTHKKNGSYTLYERRTRQGEAKSYSRLRKEHIKVEKYNGKVYCVEVPTHLILVRRSGKTAICGNSVFGCMPLFQADITQTGGLNNEGLQITITNRAIKTGQEIYNNKVLPFLAEQLGITDYHIKLRSVEVKDEMSELQLQAQKIANAQAIANLGFKVKLNEDGEFEFEQGEARPQTSPAQFPLPLQISEEQRFTGSPESVRRSALKKLFDEVSKEIAPNENIILKEDNWEEMVKEIYRYVFAGLDKKTSDKMKDIILRGISEARPLTEMTKRIMEIAPELSEGEAERIVRTEDHAIRNKLREKTYMELDPEKLNKYKWIGPSDVRTTQICTNIKNRTKNGVSLEELKNIIYEEGKKGGFEPRDFSPHINCRHTLLRVM